MDNRVILVQVLLNEDRQGYQVNYAPGISGGLLRSIGQQIVQISDNAIMPDMPQQQPEQVEVVDAPEVEENGASRKKKKKKQPEV